MVIRCYGLLHIVQLFWVAAKNRNHAAWMHFEGQKMKDAVSHLRTGWYGNGHLFTNLGREPA
jgi:hypothetical protein